MVSAFIADINAQAPAIEWQKALGGTREDGAYAVQSTIDGGYIIAGSTNSTNGDLSGVPSQLNDDCWIIKVNSAGAIEWQKKYGSGGLDIVNDIKQTSEGGYIFIGRNNAVTTPDGDVTSGQGSWLVKLSGTGNIEWQASLGITGQSVEQTVDGGYVVGGSSFVARYSAAGARQWITNFPYAIVAIDATTDGGVVATGEATTSNRSDIKVVKLNGAGVIVLDKEFGTLGYEGSNDILQTTDGGYIVVGYASGVGEDHVHHYKGSADAWLVKLNSNMDTVWTNAIGGSNYDIARKVIQVNGGYIIAGETGSTDGDVSGYKGGAKDAWVFRLDDNGNLIWQKCFGGSANDIFYDVCQGSNGGYLAAGHTYSNDGDISGAHGSADLWIVKLDEDQVLPVRFGVVNATLKESMLSVNWTTLSETNCSHYIVEASANGSSFKTISDKIFTRASEGNSYTPLQYRFTRSYTIFQAMTLLLLGLSVFSKRKFSPAACLIIISGILIISSCKKSGSDIAYNKDHELYIRVVQVDEDGTKSYSEIIKVVQQ